MRPNPARLTLRVVPKDQERDVPRDATVLVTAPRPVDSVSACGVRVRRGSREIEGVVGLSSDGRILFWRPAGILDAEVEHQVTITGVCDVRGAPFDDHRSTFVTGAFSYVDLQVLLE